MNTPNDAVLFVAAHMGPYLSIKPLEEALCKSKPGLFLLDGPARHERSRENLPFWDSKQIDLSADRPVEFLVSNEVSAIVRSSSEDLANNIEELISIAAKTIGIPVFVVEDFPGNFWPNQHYSIDALFIENSCLVGLHESRGIDPNVIFATGNPRYRQFANIDRLDHRIQMREKLALSNEVTILWAGQPDCGNSYQTIQRLLGNFGRNDVTLLFKAHPRDSSYNTNQYQELFENCPMQVIDATSESDTIGLYCAADLVITQFSSAAVEASHLGTPSVFVLFEDLGKAYMRTHKGHTQLPWSRNNCSYLIENERDISTILEQALFDCNSRKDTLKNFRACFGQSTDSTQNIANTIRHLSSRTYND